jgi:hypothetical protein
MVYFSSSIHAKIVRVHHDWSIWFLKVQWVLGVQVGGGQQISHHHIVIATFIIPLVGKKVSIVRHLLPRYADCTAGTERDLPNVFGKVSVALVVA